jgi:hypothetical protein
MRQPYTSASTTSTSTATSKATTSTSASTSTSTTVRQVLSEDEAKEWGNFTLHAPEQVWLALFSDGAVAPPADVDDSEAYFSTFDQALERITPLAHHGAQPVPLPRSSV